MALTPEQRKVLAHILKVAKASGASPKEVKAAIETGLVEANLTNPSGGDADSQGWRQERASLYRDPQNLDASIGRFFQETHAVKGKYGRAGALAAAVQRPAAKYRGRYEGRSGEAQSLLGGFAGAGASKGAGAATAGSTRTVGAVDNSAQRGALIAQFINQKGADPLQFAMGVRGLQDTPGHQVTTPGATPADAATRTGVIPLGGGTAGTGKFTITGANPGRIKPSVIQFADKISAIYGHPLTGDSGATHSKMTVDGNVSQHYTGNATDIPATGAQLIRMGRAALIAAGMPRAQAMKQTGGLFNVGGHQVIFNTHLGGDHTNHLHISAR